MKRKQRQKAAQRRTLPHIFFTYEQVMLLQQALEPVESYLAKPHIQPINMELAIQTLANVRTKLHRMLHEQCWNTDVPMDANEILTLQAALLAFSYRLQILPPSSERDRSMQHCISLLGQINLVAATIPHKH